MITKYSPDDVKGLSERIKKIESDLKALKMEKKVHFTSIKDGALRILDADGDEVAKFGKISAGVYGVKINDSSGNLLINLYDPADYKINSPVYIEPAYTKAWVNWPPAPYPAYGHHTHNLGYIPSHRNAEGRGNPVNINIGGVPGGEDYIVPQEFYSAMDIEWVSETKFRTRHAETPSGKCNQWRARFLR